MFEVEAAKIVTIVGSASGTFVVPAGKVARDALALESFQGFLWRKRSAAGRRFAEKEQVDELRTGGLGQALTGSKQWPHKSHVSHSGLQLAGQLACGRLAHAGATSFFLGGSLHCLKIRRLEIVFDFEFETIRLNSKSRSDSPPDLLPSLFYS